MFPRQLKFRLHPILLPVFLLLVVMGNVSTYAIVFSSLLFHEIGHIAMAWYTGLKIRSCVIMPYGGELDMIGYSRASNRTRFLVVMGGPLATCILLGIGLFFEFPGREVFMKTQLAILGLNLLPVLPLDGGRALEAMLSSIQDRHVVQKKLLLSSVLFFALSSILLLLYLPFSIPYVLLALFLLVQNVVSYNQLKYIAAYEKLKRNRLTTSL